MDPALANQNLDPPNERVLSRGLLPALAVNALLMAALVVGVNWKFGGDRELSAAGPTPATSAEANDTSRMGGAPTPPADTTVPAWPTAAATGAASQPAEPVQPVASVTQPPEPPPAPAPRVARPEPPAPAKVAAHTPRPEPARAKAAEKSAEKRLQPSFDCAKAHSATERLICGDAELTRLDRELGRVHAQAKRAAADPQDFKRENDDEWRLRESVCRDKDCLREWYAHRREQLEERMAQGR